LTNKACPSFPPAADSPKERKYRYLDKFQAIFLLHGKSLYDHYLCGIIGYDLYRLLFWLVSALKYLKNNKEEERTL